MKIGAMNAAAVVALGLAAWTPGTAQAQPLFDRVNVNLPYTVTIGDKTLPPGDYIIQQLDTAGGDSRVVLIYSDNGMKFQTSAMSIPALDPGTPRDTKVVLHQVGSDYYLDKIWIQGKDYGYEFPLPNSVKSREKEMAKSVSVPAQYSTQNNNTNTQTASTSTTDNSTTANNSTNSTPPATASPNPANTSADQTMNAAPPPTETNAPPVVDQTPAPTTDNSVAQNSQPQSTSNSADRSSDQDADRSTDNTSMPHTSAGWLMMLLSGGTLSGLGLSLRRKQ